ncbi:S8 family peptidase [Undibacterium curvum]|uniref:S8 family peptidase n=1 Tax=Undibacterium curvum TaxID=2762294 RepID=A0ABR7A8J8_9BURK|nr:S8 family peptidase [Undibacterium curvum]MBC3933212.1 S8 family peptidase [Undibacterium curvum]
MKLILKKSAFIIAAAFSAVLVSGTTTANVTTPGKARANSQPSVQEEYLDQIIVKYRNDRFNAEAYASSKGVRNELLNLQAQRLSRLQQATASSGMAFEIKRQLATGAWVYKASGNLTTSQLLALAKKIAASDSSVEYAEPDYIMHRLAVPTDPSYASKQWDMQESSKQPGGLNAPAAWDVTLGQGIVVAVADTGYVPHEDLTANLIPAQGGQAGQYGYNFISSYVTARLPKPASGNSVRGPDALDMGDWVDANSSCFKSSGADDSSWHGTHVAGTIAAAANNGKGITGVAPMAKVLPLRVLGQCGGSTSDISDAVAWSAGLTVPNMPVNANKANVINLSLGGIHACSKTTAAAYKAAMDAGTIVVIAAGNEAIDAKLSSPANCPGVITVASTDINGARASYSNYGGTVTVAAPGGGFTKAEDIIFSTLPTGKTSYTAMSAAEVNAYGGMAGTSQATPHVAGVVALMLSVNPKLTQAQVKDLLIKTSRRPPANCPACGGGIVDAAAAVNAAKAK